MGHLSNTSITIDIVLSVVALLVWGTVFLRMIIPFTIQTYFDIRKAYEEE